LINYPEKNYDRKVASYLPLTGGSISMVVSDPAVVPGIHGVWKLAWAGSAKQVLVEVVQYQTALAPGQITLTLTHMSTGDATRIPLTISSNQTLELSVWNDTASANRHIYGILRHFEHHSGIFEVSPKTKMPTADHCCDGAACILIPTPKDLLRALERGDPRIVVGGKEFDRTADDPICPIAYFDPNA